MDAVELHSSIAESFDRGYQTSPRFIERLAVWKAPSSAICLPEEAF